MHTLERTVLEGEEAQTDTNKSSKERRGLVEIIAKAKRLMVAIIIEIEKSAIIIDQNKWQVC